MIKHSLKIKLLHRFTGHKSGVYALEAMPGTNIFWSGSGDAAVVQWNAQESKEGILFAKSKGIIYSIRINPELNHLLIGQSTGGMHVINLNSNTEERLLQNHTAPIFYVGYQPTHSLLFSLAGDGSLCILSAHDYRLIKTIKILNSKLRCVAFHNIKNECAVACGDGSIVILSLPEGEVINRFQAHQKDFSVNTVAYSPDGKYLISGSRDAHINVLSADDYSLIKSIPAHNYAIYNIAFHPSQKIMATASRDKTIKIWDTNTYEVIIKLDKEHYDGHTHSVNKLMWINDQLISTGDDRTIIVWSLNFEV